MLINGYEYKFACTVEAKLGIDALQLKTWNEDAVRKCAVIMSKGYEDQQKVMNPSYEVRYLRNEEVNTLLYKDLVQLSKEVDEAYRIGTGITVETEKPKKK